jgi:pSer/pThr/pTyr-binding forkhead associated (FHA) protein
MSFLGSPGGTSTEVLVQLLDAAHGRVVKTWSFRSRQRITIGRQRECDVEISDPYVSRLHAEMEFRDGGWSLVSRGRNGVLVQSQRIEELTIQSEATFQLGSSGPVLRFAIEHEDSEMRNTLCFDVEPSPAFALDEAQLRNDVGKILEGDHFQKLQAQAKTLRARRQS